MPYNLTKREFEVLQALLKTGGKLKPVETMLWISTRTVATHAAKIRKKLNVSNIQGAVIKAYAEGWLCHE